MIRRRIKAALGLCVLLTLLCWTLSACGVSFRPPNQGTAAPDVKLPEPEQQGASGGAPQPTGTTPSDQSEKPAQSGTGDVVGSAPERPTQDGTGGIAAGNPGSVAAGNPGGAGQSGQPGMQAAPPAAAGQGTFAPDFVKPGMRLYFNEHEVITFENNPSRPGMPAIDDNYAWATADSGESVLMILLDADHDWKGENYNLLLPKYGYPVVSKLAGYVRIVWTNPADIDDSIGLSFRIGSDEMILDKHTPKGIADNAGYSVKLALTVYDNNSGGGRYYLPLYAILNEVGGGVLRDPLGDKMDFIYSGGDLPNFTGIWETSDRGDDRRDVAIGGETVSVSTSWQCLELRTDGTFLESERYFYENEEWVLTENKGHYVLYNRILVMRYETESMYRGTDYGALRPHDVDKPAESWGGVTGAAVQVRYIEDWDGDYLQLYGRKPMYADLSRHGEAAPRPGIEAR